MRSLRLWLLVVITAAMVACGAPRIDARSDETLRDSILRVRVSLSRERQAKFDEAIYVLHAFEKRSQRTPKRDLELARQRPRALVKQRPQGGS